MSRSNTLLHVFSLQGDFDINQTDVHCDHQTTELVEYLETQATVRPISKQEYAAGDRLMRQFRPLLWKHTVYHCNYTVQPISVSKGV